MKKYTDFSSLTLEELTPIVSMRPGTLYTKEELKLARRYFMARLNKEDTEVANVLSKSAEIPTREISHEETITSNDTLQPPGDTAEFILKSESRFARILYRIYAYILLPLLAVEAILFLLETVATVIAFPTLPYLFLYIITNVLYTMFVALTWHQFLYATRLGILFSRILIFTCIGRGIGIVSSPQSTLWGILFLAVSILFLVFFFGYENTFVRPSPKPRRGR